MPLIHKIVSLSCRVCGKTYRFSVKDDMFIDVNEAEKTTTPCLWCRSFVDQAQSAYIKELRRGKVRK